MCRTLIEDPLYGAPWTLIFSESSPRAWDWLHYLRLQKAEEIVFDVQWMRLAQSKAFPVVMLTSDEAAQADDPDDPWRYRAESLKWTFRLTGYTETGTGSLKEFKTNEQYKFSIQPFHFDGPHDHFLHFGGVEYAEDVAVLTESEGRSRWFIKASAKADHLRFQFAQDGWPENGWWLSCNYGRLRFRDAGGEVRAGVLSKADHNDAEDAYQRFKIRHGDEMMWSDIPT